MSCTKCRCGKVVTVKTDGTIGYHVSFNASGRNVADTRCDFFKTVAKWTESRRIMASGRNSAGDCMRCWRNVADGPGPECPQCNIEVYHDDDRRKAAYEKDRQSRKK